MLENESNANRKVEAQQEAIVENDRNTVEELKIHAHELRRNAVDTKRDALMRSQEASQATADFNAAQKDEDSQVRLGQSLAAKGKALLAAAKRLQSRAATLRSDSARLTNVVAPHEEALAAALERRAGLELAQAKAAEAVADKLDDKANKIALTAETVTHRANSLRSHSLRDRLLAAGDVDSALKEAKQFHATMAEIKTALAHVDKATGAAPKEADDDLLDETGDDDVTTHRGGYNRLDVPGGDNTDPSLRDTGTPWQSLDDDNDGVTPMSVSSQLEGGDDNSQALASQGTDTHAAALTDRDDVPGGDQSDPSLRDTGNAWQSLDDDNDGIRVNAPHAELAAATDDSHELADNGALGGRKLRRMRGVIRRYMRHQFNTATGEYGSNHVPL